MISLSMLRHRLIGSAGTFSLLILGSPLAWADCPHCQSGGVITPTHYADHATPAMEPGWGTAMPRPPVAAMQAVLPPPGTLGKTYLRPSWPIPKEEHPRMAIIQIAAPGFTKIEIEGLEDFEGFQRADGLWIFKSKSSLIPGCPHVYQVKAGYKGANDPREAVRTVRLIPGRVVTLEF